MNYVFFAIGGMIGGFISGFVYSFIYDITHKTTGIIFVDHDNNLTQFHIASDDLKNRKFKKAVFKIDHNAKLSREEQIL